VIELHFNVNTAKIDFAVTSGSALKGRTKDAQKDASTVKLIRKRDKQLVVTVFRSVTSANLNRPITRTESGSACDQKEFVSN
jgi:hypothetical protein